MDDELFTLQRAARPLGFYVGRHKHYDPVLGGGEFFIMPRKTRQDERCPTLARYQTSEQVETFLAEQVEGYTD